jgi:hypothetical protein
MPRRGFREADGLADQAVDPRPPRQMLPRDLLGMPLARAVHRSVPMPRLRAPMRGIKMGEPAGFSQRFPL